MASKTRPLDDPRRRGLAGLADLATPFVITLSVASAASLPACWGNPGGDSYGPESDSASSTTAGSATTTEGTAATEGTASTSATEGTASTTASTTSTATSEATTTSASTSASTTGDTTEATTVATEATTVATSTTEATTTTEGTSTTGGGLGFDPLDDGVQTCSDAFAMDPVDILSAQIKGDLLFLQISYGGGCADHQFGLCWDGAFAESDPVQVGLVLAHEANDDPCDGIVMEEKAFDLGPLKQAWIDAYKQMSGTIIIHLSGYKGAIDFIF